MLVCLSHVKRAMLSVLCGHVITTHLVESDL